MKKYLLILLLSLSFTVVSAQVDDRTETDCDAASETIYDVLGEGKVLLIAADGFDCSICMSHAGAIKTFADDNKANITVWGAMNFKYSAAMPTCGDIDDWRSTYGWNNVFMFLDESKFWINGGYPNYTVIDPSDSSIAYEGFNHSEAMSTAASLAGTTSVKTVSNDTYKVYVSNNTLVSTLSNTVTNPVLEIIDITGKTIVTYKQLSQNGDNTINVVLPETMQAGIYFAVMRTREKAYTAKFYKN